MRRAWCGIKQGVVNQPVLGRKFCPHCGRWRPVSDFSVKRRAVSGLSPTCLTCDRVEMRERRRHRTPAQRAGVREYQRMYAEAKRREAGLPIRVRKGRARPRAVDRIERVLLDSAPLVIELRRRDQTALARRSGVSEKAIYRLLVGESRRVRIDVADKLAVGMGLTLSLIYTDERAVA